MHILAPSQVYMNIEKLLFHLLKHADFQPPKPPSLLVQTYSTTIFFFYTLFPTRYYVT